MICQLYWLQLCIPDGYMCYWDPLLHFPFAYDFNDIQCPKAAGMGHGNAYIDKHGGYMRLDGDGDYMTVSIVFVALIIFASNTTWGHILFACNVY